MIKLDNIQNYIKKVFSKWFIYISILPGLADTIGFYFGFESPLLSWRISSYIFAGTLFVATYLVWKEKCMENIKLQKSIEEYNNKKPKLKLTFGNKEDCFILKNKIFERKLEEQTMGVRPIPQHILQRLANSFLGNTHNLIIDEFKETFIPLKFELHNEGDFKATNIRVDIYFSKDLVLIKELPEQTNLFPLIKNYPKRRSGLYFQEKNHIRLWCEESLHPDYIEFDEIYISANKKKEFNVKYEIFCEEIDSKGIRGELKIELDPIKEIRNYTIKEEFERDQREYEEMLKHQLEKTIDEN